MLVVAASAPARSNRPRSLGAVVGSIRVAAYAVVMPTGTLIRKIASQPNCSVSTPPRRAPDGGTDAPNGGQAARSQGRCGPTVKAVVTRDSAAGESNAAPTP